MRQTVIWLSRVRAELGDGLNVVWRSFALEQSNSKEGPEWKAWEQGPEYVSRGLLALRAGAAARRQGDDEHWRFALNLLEAKHVDRQDIRDRGTVLGIAGDCVQALNYLCEITDITPVILGPEGAERVPPIWERV